MLGMPMPHAERPFTDYELSPLVEVLARKFINRWDMYPMQLEDGRWVTLHEALHVGLLFAHLRGEMTLGTYLLDKDSQGRFLFLDADDEESWLDAQSAYPGIVNVINAQNEPLCIITTKEDRFTRKLVARFGIRVDAERIYALESFEGGGKRSVLEKLAREFPHRTLHFFEDRLATLQSLGDTALARLYLVDWGYNTASERAHAAAIDGIEVLDMAHFLSIIEGA